MKYYIGIDGGGTKTEFILTDEQENVLSRIVKKGSNPNDVGIEKSHQVLSSGLKEILQGKEIEKENVHIFSGIAGAGIVENARTLQAMLEEEYPNVKVASDLINAWELCLHGEDGIVVICGTGICCCVVENGGMKTVGGYGYLFEDGGSAYAYGRDAVNVALKYEDGIGEKTVLLEYLQTRFGKTVRANLGNLQRKGKFFVASFCPLVFQGYAAGDNVCKKIIENNLEYTVQLVKGALAVASKKIEKIAFIGGVSKELVFQERMQKEFIGHEILFSKEQPVFGALRRAMKTEKGEQKNEKN